RGVVHLTEAVLAHENGEQQEQVPGGSLMLYCRSGRHVVLPVDDLVALPILWEEGVILVRKLAANSVSDGHCSPSSVLPGYRSTRSPFSESENIIPGRHPDPSQGRGGPARPGEDAGRPPERTNSAPLPPPPWGTFSPPREVVPFGKCPSRRAFCR